jgi:hypothetical protein
VSHANQWVVAKGGGVEALTAAMAVYPHSSLIQLSSLLALVPLALGNPMMQVGGRRNGNGNNILLIIIMYY